MGLELDHDLTNKTEKILRDRGIFKYDSFENVPVGVVSIDLVPIDGDVHVGLNRLITVEDAERSLRRPFLSSLFKKLTR